MTRFKLLLFTLSVLAAAWFIGPLATRADETKAGPLGIEHAWARPSLGSAPNSAAYLTVTNHGEKPDKLLGASSDAASRVQIHMMKMEGGIMKMRPVEGGIEVPANATVSLKPGGFHMMLMGLTRKLEVGQTFQLTLRFEKQGEVPVQVKVEKSGAMGDHSMSGHFMSGGKGHAK